MQRKQLQKELVGKKAFGERKSKGMGCSNLGLLLLLLLLLLTKSAVSAYLVEGQARVEVIRKALLSKERTPRSVLANKLGGGAGRGGGGGGGGAGRGGVGGGGGAGRGGGGGAGGAGRGGGARGVGGGGGARGAGLGSGARGAGTNGAGCGKGASYDNNGYCGHSTPNSNGFIGLAWSIIASILTFFFTVL